MRPFVHALKITVLTASCRAVRGSRVVMAAAPWAAPRGGRGLSCDSCTFRRCRRPTGVGGTTDRARAIRESRTCRSRRAADPGNIDGSDRGTDCASRSVSDGSSQMQRKPLLMASVHSTLGLGRQRYELRSRVADSSIGHTGDDRHGRISRCGASTRPPHPAASCGPTLGRWRRMERLVDAPNPRHAGIRGDRHESRHSSMRLLAAPVARPRTDGEHLLVSQPGSSLPARRHARSTTPRADACRAGSWLTGGISHRLPLSIRSIR